MPGKLIYILIILVVLFASISCRSYVVPPEEVAKKNDPAWTIYGQPQQSQRRKSVSTPSSSASTGSIGGNIGQSGSLQGKAEAGQASPQTSQRHNPKPNFQKPEPVSFDVARISVLRDLGFRVIFEETSLANIWNVALVIGPGIAEEAMYPEIIEYVKSFGDAEQIFLYSYLQENGESEMLKGLREILKKYFVIANDSKTAYFNRYLKSEREVIALRKFLEPYEKEGRVEYRGSVSFE